MYDDVIFLTCRVDCIAGRPPPTKGYHQEVYVLSESSSARSSASIFSVCENSLATAG